MSEPHFPTIADGGPDDLPRTLRREREAREREAREREQAAAAMPHMANAHYGPDMAGTDAPAARVTRFDVPFLHLVAFFLKAALAAIPGLLVLGLILWAVGHAAQIFFPQLLKMQILIWFPNNP